MSARVSVQCALAQVAGLPVLNPKLAILNACCSGQIAAHGRIFDEKWRGTEDVILPDVWQEFCRLSKRQEEAWNAGEPLLAKESQFDWQRGEFELVWPTERGPTILHVTDVWFLRSEFDAYFRAPVSPSVERESAAMKDFCASSEEQTNKGGRPPAPHGQAIGAVVLRLATLAGNEQARSTTESVAADLKAEYAKLGASVHVQSLKKHAQGILRALRAKPFP